MGNYPMRIRWQVHRYLLKQSMTFFQDEFAGRIATKLMQTALAVRECVMKLIDVLIYVVVYFLGVLLIVGSADWRLAMPLVVWLVGYILLLRYFIPRLGKVAEEQADARSTMTGRIVDSYTNIPTVKLFSHARREASYAREGMAGFLDTVYRPMRLVTHAVRLPLRAQFVAAVSRSARCRSGCGSATRSRSAPSRWCIGLVLRI